ncbi:YhjD/YihY/BrkB family envelope integrity protein [Reinekea sp.]|jgi:membrane protein|uniref:YhjD/YihY/BrkB family envelope integrity protein n=1 Tax=Reinekea sp. TaxID=1970455 RepID=UPI002A80CD8A|nr:YhjD/YihY/BrkB family envelope integrity protein [Reinekea sp.]
MPKRLSNFLRSEVLATAHVGQHAAVLTLATLFTLVPLVSGLAWLISQVPGYQTQLYDQLEVLLSYLVPDQAIAWRTRVDIWSVDASSLQPFSLLMLFASLLFLVNRVDNALFSVFQFDRERRKRRWFYYLGVMPGLMAIITVSMTLVVLLQVLLGTGLGWVFGRLGQGVNLSSILALWLLLFAVYRWSSRSRVANRHNLLVSLAVTLTFYLLKMGFAWLYLTLPNWSLVLGVFSAIPLFLLWCQMAWSLLLYGALCLRFLS